MYNIENEIVNQLKKNIEEQQIESMKKELEEGHELYDTTEYRRLIGKAEELFKAVENDYINDIRNIIDNYSTNKKATLLVTKALMLQQCNDARKSIAYLLRKILLAALKGVEL